MNSMNHYIWRFRYTCICIDVHKELDSEFKKNDLCRHLSVKMRLNRDIVALLIL